MKIFVLTHNAHRHLLKGFSYLFNKFWEREQKIIVLGYKYPLFKLPDNFSFVSLGQNDHPEYWSIDLNKYFSSIDDDFIQWCNVDFWLGAPIDFKLYDIILSMLNKKVGRFGLTTDIMYSGKWKIFKNYNSFDIIERPLGVLVNEKRNLNFRISGTWSIWNRKYLLRYLPYGRNPWEFELKGSKESINDGYKILGTNRRYVNKNIKCNTKQNFRK